MISELQSHPKSVVFEKGYINVYSKLDLKERRQLGYKRRYKKENPSWDETMVYLAKKFLDFCGKDPVILDAGCGNGNYVIDENRQKIAWAAGVDVSGDAVKKNICLDEIKTANLEKLPFDSGSFDVVISLWVLEHLEHPEEVFREIKRVLKPGGIFMFATPNSDYLPLKIGQLLKSAKLKQLLNKYLFGRKKEDIFPAYYKANSLKNLENLSKELFTIKELKFNPDVSYTSFNNLSYLLSKLVLKLPNTFAKLTCPHIIGILCKS